MRYLLLVCATLALATRPVSATLYTYTYGAQLTADTILGSSESTIRGDFTFSTDQIIMALGGTTVVYVDELTLPPSLSFSIMGDETGITLNSIPGRTQFWIDNDVESFGDYLAIRSVRFESAEMYVQPYFEVELVLRDTTSQAITSHQIPQGLPPLSAFDITTIDFAGIPIANITSITYIPPGDLNRDGFVGIDDLGHVLASWNQTFPPGEFIGDPSGDGFVGIDDLNLVLANWNAGSPPINPNPIPEPTTLSLLALGALSTLHRQHN